MQMKITSLRGLVNQVSMCHIITCVYVFIVKKFHPYWKKNHKSFKFLPMLPILENVTIKIWKPKFNPHTEKQTKHSKEGISLTSFFVCFLRQGLLYPKLVLNS